MRMRKLVFLVLVVTALVSLAPAASAVSEVDILTDYFYQIPFGGQICADIQPDAAGVPVTFKGVTPWSTIRTAGPVLTNALGTACVRTIWPQSIYTLTASANGITSDPVAVAFWNPRDFCGAISAAELHIQQYGFFPNNLLFTQEPRVASGAMIFKQPTGPGQGTTFAAIYYDNDNPAGAVKFDAKSFMQFETDNYGYYQSMEFLGVGYFQQGAGPRTLVHYDLYVDDYPDDSYFHLSVYRLTGELIYTNDSYHIFKGKAVVELCPG